MVFIRGTVCKYQCIFSYHAGARRIWKHVGGQMHDAVLEPCQVWLGKMNPFQLWVASGKLFTVSNYSEAPAYLGSHRVLTCLSSLPVFATWVSQSCAYYLVSLNLLFVWGSLYFVKLHFLTCSYTPRSECLMARRWLCVTIVLIEWNNP